MGPPLNGSPSIELAVSSEPTENLRRNTRARDHLARKQADRAKSIRSLVPVHALLFVLSSIASKRSTSFMSKACQPFNHYPDVGVATAC